MNTSNAETNTIIAALRYYQQCGLADPSNRSNEIHDIAGIDNLCLRINTGHLIVSDNNCGVHKILSNALESRVLKYFLKKAIEEVEAAAFAGHISPEGFSIDERFDNFGTINTGGVVDIIIDAGCCVGEHKSPTYLSMVNVMCEALTEHFSQSIN